MIFRCYECGKLLKENEVVIDRDSMDYCHKCFAEYRDNTGFLGGGKSTKESIKKTLKELKILEAKK